MKNYENVRCVNADTGKVRFIPKWITEDESLMKKYNLILQDFEKKIVNLENETETPLQFETEQQKKRRRRNNNF
jgi:hypothetical protein